MDRRREERTDSFLRAIVKVLDQAPRALPVSTPRIVGLEHVRCSVCDEEFSSKQACAAHSYRAHGVKCQERLHNCATSCPRCLVEVHTRQRILDHLRGNSDCRVFVLGLPSVDDAEVLRLDAASLEETRANRRLGRQRNWAEKPSVQLCGPIALPI